MHPAAPTVGRMAATNPQTPPAPPVPRVGDDVRTVHGDSVPDPYAWLSDAESPEVISHLEAENAYAEAVTAGLAPLREQIVAEIRGRTRETDLSVPVFYKGWWYFTRTREGLQYGISCRVPDDGSGRPSISEETGPGRGGRRRVLLSRCQLGQRGRAARGLRRRPRG